MHPPLCTRVIALVAALALATPAAAEPPAGDMEAASAAFAEAEAKRRAGDPDGAIARFEAGLERLPTDPGYAPTRARVLLTIVQAHEDEFERSRDLERLRRAKSLLDRYLGSLDLLDEQGRAAAEDRRAGLISKITTVEEAQRATDADRVRRDGIARAKALGKQARALSTSGLALISVGSVGLALLGAGLGLGLTADRNIDDLKAEKGWSDPCKAGDAACPDERTTALEPLIARGNAGNVLVLVGVGGGALLATGVALLAVGRKRLRQSKQLGLAPTASASGVGVTFGLRGRF